MTPALFMELRTHPLVGLLIFTALFGFTRPLWIPLMRREGVRQICAGLCGGAIAAYCGLVLWYWWQPSFYDHAEPTIPAVAWAFGAGQPMYPSLDAPERYVHIYGPLLFLTHGVALSLAGPSIFVSKAVGAVAVLLSVAVSYRTMDRQATRLGTITATAGSVLVYLCFANASWWTRSDPLLILSASIGVAAAAFIGPGLAFAVVGLALGTAVNLKITGALYLLPALMLLYHLKGARQTVHAMGIATAVAVLPFLHPGISLRSYLDYLALSASTGLEFAKVRANAEWALFVLAPLSMYAPTIWRSATWRTERQMSAVLVVAIALVVIAASKPGAGPLHLLPFVPTLAFLWARLTPADPWRTAGRSVGPAFLAIVVAIAVPSQFRLVETVRQRSLEAAVQEIDDIMADHPHLRAAVGYAGISYLSHARVHAVFRANEYHIDAPAIQEHRLAGLELPRTTMGLIDRCAVDLWLIPRDGEPFLVPSAYSPRGPATVFPESFRALFLARYERVDRRRYFDVWMCSAPPRPWEHPIK